ncbi:MAG: glycosyl hydrolase family 18 protein [Akkermansia sp.]
MSSLYSSLRCLLSRPCLLLLLGVVAALPLFAAPEISAHQAKYLYLPAVPNQLLFRVQIKAKGGAQVGGMSFRLKGDGAKSIEGARLYACAAPFFSPESNQEDRAELLAQAQLSDNQIVVSCKHEQQAEAMNYFLAVDVAADAKAGQAIDAVLEGVMIDGQKVSKIKGADPDGWGVVDAGQKRLTVYYRAQFLADWAKGGLTKAAMNGLTNVILFQVQPGADGSVVPLSGKGNASSDMAKLTKAASMLKSLRDGRPITISLGVKTGEFKTVCADSKLSDKLAKELVATCLKLGLDGLDLDYEYPQSPAEWRRFCLFVTRLREEMQPHQLLLTTAISAFYCVPSIAVLDQFDLVHAMSYDHGGEQHSSFADHEKDLATLTQQLKQPASKVLIGVPMYTNATDANGKVMWGNQHGWRDVVSYFKKMGAPLYDHINHLKGWSHDVYRHNFNGRDLLNQKCAHLLEHSYGGLMVWGFETDVDYEDLQSEMRFMHEVFIPEQGYTTIPMNRDSSVSPSLKYLQMNFDEALSIKSSKPVELWASPKRVYAVKDGRLGFENQPAKLLASIPRSQCKLSKDACKMRVALPSGRLAMGGSYFIKIAEDAIAFRDAKSHFGGVLHDVYWNFSCAYLVDGNFRQQLHGLPHELGWTYRGKAGQDYELKEGSLHLLSPRASIEQCSRYAPKKGDRAELIIRMQEGGSQQQLRLTVTLVHAKTGSKTVLAEQTLAPHDERSCNLLYWSHDFTKSVPDHSYLSISLSPVGDKPLIVRELVLQVSPGK